MRMLMNNLDPEVAERPEDLVVYGGTGRAARSWEAYDAIVRTLRTLGDDETLLVQSGKPVAVFRTHDMAPRVLISNSMLVPEMGRLGDVPRARGAGAHDVRADDRGLVDLHRDPGHPAGHVRDPRRVRAPALRRFARRHDHADGRARRHGRGPAAGGDDERRRRALRRRRPRADRATDPDALPRPHDRRSRRGRAPGPTRRRPRARRSRSGWWATPPRSSPRCSGAGSPPTWSPTRPAHTTRSAGTCPRGCRCPRPMRSGASPTSTSTAPTSRWPTRWTPWWASPQAGSVVFDYGNNLRAGAVEGGLDRDRAYSLPGVRAGVRAPALLRGQGTVPLGGAQRRSGRHRRDRPRGGRAVPGQRPPAPLAAAWPPSVSPSRGCPHGSVGSATASAIAPGSASTRWWPRARCRRRS